MTGVPREAAIGFDRGAEDYERGRPGYPDAAIDVIGQVLGLGPGRRVLDLAAGTGKLTRALRRLDAEILAVEPVAGMREQLQRAVPGVEVIDGTAEAIPLPDAAVDAVTVAQAFHWFDIAPAAAEIQRVLAPGGGLAIVRNEWDESVAWVGELRHLIAEHGGQAPRSHSRSWRTPLLATGRFSPLQERIIPHPVVVDLPTLGARVTSLSYVAMLSPERRRGLLDAVGQLVRNRNAIGPDGMIQTPYLTHVVWTRALPRS